MITGEVSNKGFSRETHIPHLQNGYSDTQTAPGGSVVPDADQRKLHKGPSRYMSVSLGLLLFQLKNEFGLQLVGKRLLSCT